jgi:hypothetical protein
VKEPHIELPGAGLLPGRERDLDVVDADAHGARRSDGLP